MDHSRKAILTKNWLVSILLAIPLALTMIGPGHNTPQAQASGCGHPIVDILYYQSHVAPNAPGVSPQPNSCWSWSDMRGVNQPNWRICSVNNPNNPYPHVDFYGTGPGYAYDDTNASHANENTVIKQNCLGTNTQLYLEYEAPGGCSSPNWIGRVPSGVSVYHFLLETYCSDSGRDIASFVNAFTYTSTVGGVVNIGADVPNSDGGPCASSCQTHLTSDIQAVCNQTPAGLSSAYTLTIQCRRTWSDGSTPQSTAAPEINRSQLRRPIAMMVAMVA